MAINNFEKLWRHLRHYGIRSALIMVAGIFVRVLFRKRARCWNECLHAVVEKTGMEIGGPSRMFSGWGLLPVYSYAGRVDCCNFMDSTVWEGSLKEGEPFGYGKRQNLGRQYIREATDLHGIPSEGYDFLCSSHMIEHAANSLKALFEWKRVLKEGGAMLLVVPHKEGTFDHRRPVTTLDHLVEDFSRDIGEDDLTHMEEILELHDLKRDPGAGDFENFKRRARDNYANRCLHHHVFDTDLVVRMVDYVGLKICAVEPSLPHNIIVVCNKVSRGQDADNSIFLDGRADYRSRSPFLSDKKCLNLAEKYD